ncbi:hypothetical protein Tdes44962_MAKER09111 [Teratosphaeria destructans]|uniref:Uncharacterized protein n=1 Tax=Teratosphaeria destructans TaxID=418781 RepID=A0A9W7STZ4_9PEZI|nr:hypothetical protein Tdes44962_MAKER09111 [Teratosphaeria destructans]
MTEKDAAELLQKIPFAVDHSCYRRLLEERCETMRSANPLRTYWHTILIVRNLETGCVTISRTTSSQKKPPGLSQLRSAAVSELKTFCARPRAIASSPALLFLLALLGNSLRTSEHIQLALLQDPAGSEWLRPLIELMFKHTKGTAGLKDARVVPAYLKLCSTCLVPRRHDSATRLAFQTCRAKPASSSDYRHASGAWCLPMKPLSAWSHHGTRGSSPSSSVCRSPQLELPTKDTKTVYRSFADLRSLCMGCGLLYRPHKGNLVAQFISAQFSALATSRKTRFKF